MESYLPIIFMLLILFIIRRQENKEVIKRIINKKGKGKEMLTLAEKFIGKRCIFYTFNSQVYGTVKEIRDGGILIEEKGEEQIINPDYIVRIREYPKNNKGKYKNVIFD